MGFVFKINPKQENALLKFIHGIVFKINHSLDNSIHGVVFKTTPNMRGKSKIAKAILELPVIKCYGSYAWLQARFTRPQIGGLLNKTTALGFNLRDYTVYLDAQSGRAGQLPSIIKKGRRLERCPHSLMPPLHLSAPFKLSYAPFKVINAMRYVHWSHGFTGLQHSLTLDGAGM